MTLSLLLITMLSPLAWHLFNDRAGDAPKDKAQDIFIVVLLAIVVGVIHFWLAGKPIVDAALLALCIHFFAFDYLIVIILKKRRVIETKESAFSYLGSSWTDDQWRKIKPWYRFFVRLGVLAVGVITYIA